MRRPSTRMGLIAAGVLIAVVALATTAAARTTAPAAAPIVIGWAYDGKGAMAPFDNPALAAAQLRVKALNAKGGVNGRTVQIRTCDTQGNKAAIAKACALKLLGGGADVMFTTCDVDFAAPVVQETINRGVLAVAPCIGTDQMGPKRFGAKGRLAFSYGNVAQDEGSAMAQYAYGKGWRTAALATDTVIVYFKDVVKAFEARFKQLGGKIVDARVVPVARRQQRAERGQPPQRREGRRDRHVDGRCVRRAVDADLGSAQPRQRHAGAQLVGGRRQLLAAEEPEGDQLLVRHLRVGVRRRSDRRP